MKKIVFLFLGIFATTFFGYSQADLYNLKSQNLHKKVAKTIEHSYVYSNKSGGFVKTSVTIKSYNDDGLLTEKFYQYNSTYSGTSSTTETLYHYNSKNQLTRTEDISAKKSSYSSHNEYTYDNKGNLIKREGVYRSGNRYVYKFQYDNRNRLVRAEDYNSKGDLSARETYTYNGNKKTKVRKSYNSKTGNVSGTYTTYYKNDKSIRYTSSSKYSNNDVTYAYDKRDNLIASNYKGKPKSSSSYHYDYDNRDNWIRKHYKYGTSSNTFTFREVIFRNGNTTGSTGFDRNYINRRGNFANVAVVPIIPTKKSTTKNTTTKNTTTYSDPSMPVFKNKNYIFNYVNLSKKVSSVNGEVTISVKDNDRMSKNSTVEITYSFGGKTYRDNYSVTLYSNIKDKGYYFWSLKSKTKSTKVSFTINHKKKFIESRDMYLSGMLNLNFNGKDTGFYLEE